MCCSSAPTARLDQDNALELVEGLQKLVDSGGQKIIVDCSRLDYILSFGMSVLLCLQGKINDRGDDMKISAIKGFVRPVLRAVKLDRVFGSYPDVGQARLAFRPAGPERSPNNGIQADG